MFVILPQIYPKDFVDFFICNYFWFLDYVFYRSWYNLIFKILIKWWMNLIQIYNLFSKNLPKTNFLDINLKINNKLQFDAYHKPTNFFSYLHYKSCHPPHSKNNIASSLARCIVWIVTDNTNNWLQEFKGHLLKRKHLEK